MSTTNNDIGRGEINQVSPITFVYNDNIKRLYGIMARYNKEQTYAKGYLCGEEFGIRIQIPPMSPHGGCYLEAWRGVTHDGQLRTAPSFTLYDTDGKTVIAPEKGSGISLRKWAEDNDRTIIPSMQYAETTLETHLQAAMAIGNLKEEKTLLFVPWIRCNLWVDWRCYHQCDPKETDAILRDPERAPWIEKNSEFTRFYAQRLADEYHDDRGREGLE